MPLLRLLKSSNLAQARKRSSAKSILKARSLRLGAAYVLINNIILSQLSIILTHFQWCFKYGFHGCTSMFGRWTYKCIDCHKLSSLCIQSGCSAMARRTEEWQQSYCMKHRGAIKKWSSAAQVRLVRTIQKHLINDSNRTYIALRRHGAPGALSSVLTCLSARSALVVMSTSAILAVVRRSSARAARLLSAVWANISTTSIAPSKCHSYLKR